MANPRAGLTGQLRGFSARSVSIPLPKANLHAVTLGDADHLRRLRSAVGWSTMLSAFLWAGLLALIR